MLTKSKPIRWTIAIIVLCTVVFLSFYNFRKSINTSSFVPHFDKIVHLGMYFTLYVSWASINYSKKLFLALLFVGVVLFGGIIEIFQPIFSERDRDFYDALVNSIGAGSGLLYMIWYKRKKAANE